MRADADFMVYVGARWPALVREAVLLGSPPEQAADVTADALARCRRGWDRASREEDVDALVRRELEAATARKGPRTSEGERAQAAEDLLVLAPPTLPELRVREREANRRTLKQAAFVAVPLLLVVAGLTWWTVRDDPEAERPERLPPAAVTRAENPAPGVTWYADGLLHLDHVVLEVEGLRDMTRLGTGVVYGDAEGRVVHAADDGTRKVLGHKDPLLPVAGADENGWAAWVDTTDADTPTLVVKEASRDNMVGELSVDAGTRVIAVDGETVYFVDRAGAHGLLPATETVIPVTPADLLDVRSRIRAFQLDSATIQVVQSFFDVEFALPGEGAMLSADGNVVVTRNDGEVTLFDTRSGKQFPNGLSDDDSTLAVSAGVRGTIAYIVAPGGLAPGRDLELRTCELSDWTVCRIVARIPNTGATPVLAR